jgi:hypothetical protein
MAAERKVPANKAVWRRSSPRVVVPDSACHAGGRAFESRRSRLYLQRFRVTWKAPPVRSSRANPAPATTRRLLGAGLGPLRPRASTPGRGGRSASTQASGQDVHSGLCVPTPPQAGADSPPRQSSRMRMCGVDRGTPAARNRRAGPADLRRSAFDGLGEDVGADVIRVPDAVRARRREDQPVRVWRRATSCARNALSAGAHR